jgi:hypothetical protein
LSLSYATGLLAKAKRVSRGFLFIQRPQSETQRAGLFLMPKIVHSLRALILCSASRILYSKTWKTRPAIPTSFICTNENFHYVHHFVLGFLSCSLIPFNSSSRISSPSCGVRRCSCFSCSKYSSSRLCCCDMRLNQLP